MTDDGVYIEGSYYTVNGYAGEELARITATSKAMLADMIVDTVSGKLNLEDHLEGDEKNELLANLGLHADYYDVPNEGMGNTHNLITVVTKRHEEESSPELGQELASILTNLGEERGFDPETVEEILALPFEEALEIAYSYLIQAGLNADEVLI